MASLTAFAGSVPQNYDSYLGPLFFEPYALDLVARVNGQGLHRVLEMACGTGRVTRHLVQKLPPDAQFIATDLNEAMLNLAAGKITDPRIEWSVADAQNLPFAEASFDLVVCQYGVMFFPDKAKAFAEAFRVLKSGGAFLFNTWDEIRQNALADVAHKVLKEFYADGSGGFMEKGPHSFYNPAEIERLLAGAGFRKIAVDPVALTSTAATADDGANGILDGTPLSAFLSERNADREPIKKRLREALESRFGTTNLQLPMRAFVCRGTKP